MSSFSKSILFVVLFITIIAIKGIYAQQKNEDLLYFVAKADNYSQKGNYQKAIELNLRLVEYLSKNSTNQGEVLHLDRLHHLGKLYYLTQNYDKSLYYLKKQQNIEAKSFVSPEVNLYLAKIYKETQHLDSSGYFAQKAFLSAREIGNQEVQYQSKVLINTLQDLQQVQKGQKVEIALLKAEKSKNEAELNAQKAKEKAKREKDSLNLIAKEEQLKRENEKAKQEKQLLEQDKKNLALKKEKIQAEAEKTQLEKTQAIQNYLLWGALLLIILAVFFVIYIFRSRQKEKKAKQAMESKNQELEALSEELRQQTDTVTAQRDSLETQKNDIQEKAQELEALSEELRQQNEIVESKNIALEELQETKDLMISAVNHDLRNPLNPILNYSSPSYPNKDKKNLMGMIHERAKNMLSLIDDIMDVYRAESLQLNPVPASPFQAAEQAIKVISEAQLKKPLILNEIPQDIQALFEFKYIERVLENFLSNAVKYTKPEAQGGIVTLWAKTPLSIGEKEIKPSPFGEGLGGVKLGITDNGMGIPKDKLKEIFLPFTNPNAKHIGGAKSVGIGLTFCKTIVEAHKSKIEVESTEGEGTTFSFVLPLVQKQETIDTEDALANIEDLVLTESEKMSLQDISQKIKLLSLRDSKLRKLLKAIPTEESDNIARWQKALQQARQERKQAIFDVILEKAHI